MLKLTRFFSSRNELVGNFLPKKINYVKDALLFGHSPLQLQYSTGGAGLLSTGKTYADYSIFKGKAALSMIPILPKFSKLDSGSSKVDRKGVVLLTFMPAIGTRKYDPEKRQAFALSATEVGSLISLGPSESCEFIHDPSMKSSLEGQVKKTLAISPMGNDAGYFFSLNVVNNAQKTSDRLSLPVSKAEFAVMRAACGFVLPHIMGWDQAMRPRLELSGTKPSKTPEVRLDPDLEWER